MRVAIQTRVLWFYSKNFPLSLFLIICCMEIFFASMIAFVMLTTLPPMSFLVSFPVSNSPTSGSPRIMKTIPDGFEGRFTFTMIHSIEPSSKVTPPGGHDWQIPFLTRLNVFAGHGLGMPFIHSNPKIIIFNRGLYCMRRLTNQNRTNNLPGGQFFGLSNSVLLHLILSGQSMQNVCFNLVWYFPIGHGIGSSIPFIGHLFARSHFSHLWFIFGL